MDYRMKCKSNLIFCNPLFFLLSLFLPLLASCDDKSCRQADNYNDKSYYFHYRNLDSAEHYANKALEVSGGYDDGRAEALNNQAFVKIAQMDYQQAWQLLDEASDVTDNQIELLVADVQYMRLCQRMSRNREFYEYRERALGRLKRINEERYSLPERMLSRLVYAESEFAIVNSTYYYYVGLELQSIEAISAIEETVVQRDTAQYLNYLYNIGSGGIITDGTQEEIRQEEFECLIKCYALALESNSTFFIANSLEALSLLFSDASISDLLIANNPLSMRFILQDEEADSETAVLLASKSLQLFEECGDVYQIAGANRSLASCYMAAGDYETALVYFERALSDERIMQAPDLVASIREQLSVAYSAINDKQASDYNRNIYIDLQEQTRQDRSLEARADMLEKASVQQNAMILAVLIAIIVLLLMLWLFYRRNNKRKQKDSLDSLLQPLHKWQEDNEGKLEMLREQREDINEKLILTLDRVKKNQLKLLEHRTRISLVNGITPFIDRIINELNQLNNRDESEAVRNDRFAYILELIDKINEYNDVLTHWIEMRRGELSMRIESFALQPLFDILSKGKTAFAMKGIQLNVEETTAVVKADRVLTLFMINTLADNARKFTQSGGSVDVRAVEHDDYVEISVSDTGQGMTEEQLNTIFDHKVYNGHGFGLMNCKGIIEKYRKTSRIFHNSVISAESKQGSGSRFYFRLPRGIVRTVILMCAFAASSAGYCQEANVPHSNLYMANTFADSVYISNIEGSYEKTLQYADSSRKYLNRHYLQYYPDGKLLMQRIGELGEVIPEIKWFRDSIATDYSIILDIRNESAVAALALHDWALYEYNNKIYTQLFREVSADNTLEDYCRTMQQSQTNKTIAIIILVIILIMILPAYYLLYYRHRIYYRFCVERIKKVNEILLDDSTSEDKLKSIDRLVEEQYPSELQSVVMQIREALIESVEVHNSHLSDIEIAEDECRKVEYEYDSLYVCNSVLDNCLSTLKHETMYYPSRLRQLMADTAANLESIRELVSYYRDIHSVLSEQSMRQLARIKLRMAKVSIMGIQLIGDAGLLNYMFDFLLKTSGEKKESVQITELPDGYVRFSVPMPSMQLTEQQAKDLFNPSSGNFMFMLCRQIVRDHSEYTNRRRCGIEAEIYDGCTYVNIVLVKAR